MFKDNTSYKCAKYSIANARYMLLFILNLDISKCLHKKFRNVTSPFMIFLPHLYIALYTVIIKDESLFKKKKEKEKESMCWLWRYALKWNQYSNVYYLLLLFLLFLYVSSKTNQTKISYGKEKLSIQKKK
jgi:hypothetical protein